MVLGLSHSLKILSHHGIQVVGNELGVTSILWVLLSVEEPLWNVVIGWSSDDITDSFDFFFVQFS